MKSFINYYEILEISPSSSAKVIERTFRFLARRFHPDNQATGDRSKFDAVVEAHSTLRDAAKRARYHDDHHPHLPPFAPEESDEEEDGDGSADPDTESFFDSVSIDRDASIQNNILTLLYLRRRANVREPGIGNAELERLTGCSHEHLEFHIWYLRSKGWIATGEDGLLSITIDGVDRAALISKERTKKLITDQS